MSVLMQWCCAKCLQTHWVRVRYIADGKRASVEGLDVSEHLSIFRESSRIYRRIFMYAHTGLFYD